MTQALNLPFYIPKERWSYTDYNRIYAELLDLPCKQGYGRLFRVEVRSLNPDDLVFPILHINFRGKWLPFQLVLIGYPKYIDGFFIVPPSINGRRHPHVFSSGDICWELENDWEPGMTLYEDYIRFLLNILHKPRE